MPRHLIPASGWQTDWLHHKQEDRAQELSRWSQEDGSKYRTSCPNFGKQRQASWHMAAWWLLWGFGIPCSLKLLCYISSHSWALMLISWYQWDWMGHDHQRVFQCGDERKLGKHSPEGAHPVILPVSKNHQSIGLYIGMPIEPRWAQEWSWNGEWTPLMLLRILKTVPSDNLRGF